MFLLSNIIILSLFCPFSTFSTKQCSTKESLVQNPKNIIKNSLYTLIETRNTFLKPSELNVNQVVSKYKKSIQKSNSNHQRNSQQAELLPKKVFLKNCQCYREIFSAPKIGETESLCSAEASMRGQGQSYISKVL
jgi:hypothetical protein